MSRYREAAPDDKALVATRIPARVHKALEARAEADGYTVSRYIALVLTAHVGEDPPVYSNGRGPNVQTSAALPQRMRNVPQQTERIKRKRNLTEFLAAGAPADARREYSLTDLQAVADAKQPAASQSHQAVRAADFPVVKEAAEIVKRNHENFLADFGLSEAT